MSTKDFKKGMVAGAKPFGDKLDQLADVSESAVADIKEGLDSVSEVVNVVLDDLSAQEKKRIYDLDAAVDIFALEADEQEYLVAVLAELANILPAVTEQQQKYLFSLCSIAGVATPQVSLDLASIENVESMKTQKNLLRHVMEFLFIGEQDYAFLDRYKDNVFCYFSINQRGIEEIQTAIDRIFHAMGVEGIANRYAFAASYEEEDQFVDEPLYEEEAPQEDPSAPLAQDERLSEKDFSALAELIHARLGRVFSDEKSSSKQASQGKRINQFIEKYAPQVIQKTAIAVGTLSLGQVMFTTSGIYIHELWSECIYVKYADIDISRSTVDHKKKILTLINSNGKVLHKLAGHDGFLNNAEFLDLIGEIQKVKCADHDTADRVADMDSQTKFLYSKALLIFSALCKQEPIEALRMAHDLSLDDAIWDDVMDYAEQVNTEDFDAILQELMVCAPYPSEESVRYSLLQDMVAFLQFSSGRTRDITGDEDRVLRHAAKVLQLNTKVMENLIPAAQINYRVLKEDITKKEMDKIGKALVTVAGAVGVPIATIAGSSLLFWNTLWFWLIPGIGTIIGAAALGTTAAVALLKKNKSDSEKLAAERNQILNNLIGSYRGLFEYLTTSKKLGADVLIDAIFRAAKQTDPRIKEALLDCSKN